MKETTIAWPIFRRSDRFFVLLSGGTVNFRDWAQNSAHPEREWARGSIGKTVTAR